MQASLKNQRKNVRKCEKGQQSKQKRRNSNGSVDSGDDQSDGPNTGDVAQANTSKTMSDTVLVASQSSEIESEVGRVHANGNNSDVPSDRNNVRKNGEGDVKNNSSFADEVFEGPVGEKNCDESAEKGESPDCKTTEGEGNEDHGAFKIIQENKENKSLTLDDSSISQLNTSAENDALTEKLPENFKSAAIPHFCESQKSTPASVNVERKTNLTVEIKNKFVFDLDVD